MEHLNEWFDSIYGKYHEKLLKIAWHIMSDKDLAEDMVQNVFLTMLTKYPDLKGHTNIWAWLKRVLANTIKTEMQKSYHQKEVQMDPYFDAPTTTSSHNNFYDELPPGLGDDEKEILYLHIEVGLSHKEIAERLKCTPGAARVRLFRAKAECRKLMGKNNVKNPVTFCNAEQIKEVGGVTDV